MAIELTCPTCAGRLRVGDEAAGRQIRCGRCQTVLSAPEPPPAPPAPPPFELVDDPDERPARRRRDDDDDDRSARRARRDEYDDDDDRPRRRALDEDDDERPRRARRDEYDDDDRPRRRRRGPAPSSGYSPLAVVAVVLGVVLLGGIACCGGGYMLLPGEDWKRHQSAAGGFAVDLPGPAKSDLPIPGLKNEPGLKVEGTMLLKRGEFFAVFYRDLPFGAVAGQEALDEAVKGIRNEPDIRQVVRNEQLTVSGFAGREVEYLYSDGGTYVARIVITPQRLYIAVAGGRFVRPGNTNVRRFLDSFEVTDKGPAARNPWRK
jgi:predicted Zn finger-like uncharacterized protein